MTVQQPDGAVRPDSGGVSGDPVAPALPRLAFTLTGLAQLVFALLLALALGAATSWGFSWIFDAPEPVTGYLRALAWAALFLAGWELASILGKWLLVGRLKPGRIRLWGPRYFRFWVAALLVRTAPAARLIGSPWQRWHLNACGARIGRGALLLGPTPPVADLVEIGLDSVIGERSVLSGYRPVARELILDRVQIGTHCRIGDDCVLEPGSVIGDHARLAASSSLQPGQQLPSGQSWHGSPARPMDADLPNLPRLLTQPRLSRRVRLAVYAWLQLLAWVVGLALIAHAVTRLTEFWLTDFLPAAADGASIQLATAPASGLILASAGLIIALLISVGLSTLPRLLAAVLGDNRVFPLPGGRWAIARLVRVCSNLGWPNGLFGGSALAGRRLGLLGWQLLKSPGSFEAFGQQIGQSSPSAITWGAGSVAGDQLWIANIEHSSDAFRLYPARIGADCSIGEQVTWPGAARVGSHCRIAPRTAVPVSGPIRIRASLRGSPAVETERRQSERTAAGRPMPEHYQQLADRVRYDLGTIGLQLVVSLVWLTIALTGIQILAVTNWPGWLIAFTIIVGAGLIRSTCWLVADAVARSVNPLRPIAFSVFDPRASRHHRVRRLGLEPPKVLMGTPLRPLWWRLRGAEVGRCVFDDGAELSEPSLVTIGDQACLGRGAAIQSHQSQDSSYTLAVSFVGDRAVLGHRSLLIGGTQLGTDSQVAADAVLFGQTAAAGSSWLGNPAELIESSRSLSVPSPQPDEGPLVPAPAKPRGRRPATAKPATEPKASRPAKEPTPKATRPAKEPKASKPAKLAASPEPTLPASPPVDAPPDPGERFMLLGTGFPAQRIVLAQMQTAVAVLDLSDTPLLELNLPQTLPGFGIPEECLEDDLSLRDAPITDSAEIRSLLARVLLRQLLSKAHPDYQPNEWGFIRSSAGGLRPFWPTTDEWVSISRSQAAVVAAIASGPVGVAVVPESDDSRPELNSAEWLSRSEWTWLTRLARTEAPAALARIAALKNAALKAVSEVAAAEATELDTVTEPGSVLWCPPGEPETRLHGAAWPTQIGGVPHWIAVVRPADTERDDEDIPGVSSDGRN